MRCPEPPPESVVIEYLGGLDAAQGGGSWTSEEISSAYDAELFAQRNAIRLPVPSTAGDVYPPDLAEALCRRVHRNLAMRRLPLGVQASATDGAVTTTYIGSNDPEVRRLEGPYRRVRVG